MFIFNAILQLIQSNVVFTDLFVRSGEPLRAYTPAGWHPVSADLVKPTDLIEFVERITGEQWDVWVKKVEAGEGAVDIAKTISGKARLRFNLFASGSVDSNMEESGTYAAAIRKLPLVPPDIATIGLPSDLVKAIVQSKGLWLITGPTGNGKSTTIASILNHINRTQSKHILTIEQPVEYVLTPEKCIVTQREVGTHTASFHSGLYAAMRQRPDVIMIGEVRDGETLDTMLTAAESGHLVLATLHTKNVEDAFGKLVSFFSENRGQKLGTVATCVAGVISQRLLPSADKKSLILAYEVYVNNTEGQQVIRGDTLHKLPNVIQQSRSSGAVLLNDTLADLVKQRKLTPEVALEASYDREPLRKSIW